MKMIIMCKAFCIATTWALWLALANLAFAAAEIHEPIKATITASQIPLELITRESRQYDASFAVSVKTVLYKLKQKLKLTLVDVRRSEEFARLKIPGSINIPLYAIKTKSFLKSSPIIIVNEGYSHRQLEQEGRRLRDMGFSVSILSGGMNAWACKDGPLIGDIFALQHIRQVTPQMFFQEKDFENFMVIDVSPVRSEAGHQIIPDTRHLPDLAQSDTSVAELRKKVAKYSNKPFLSVLIINDTGDRYESIERVMAKEKIPAFYLKGGLAGYQVYLQNLSLSWQPRESRIKTVNKCKPCGSEIKKESSWNSKTTKDLEE